MTEIAAKLVVDASAIGALYFREPEAELIEKRLSSVQWIAPILIDYEIASIFLKKLKLYPSLREPLFECYRLYCECPIQRVAVPLEAVTLLAKKSNLSIYDASYLWLAQEFGLELVTLDKRLSSARAKKK